MSKSRVSVEASEFASDEPGSGWVEAMISVERQDEPDEELRDQYLQLTPAELAAVYQRLKLHAEQGIWSTGTVER